MVFDLLHAGMLYPAPQIGNHLDARPADAPDESETPGFAYGDISHTRIIPPFAFSISVPPLGII